MYTYSGAVRCPRHHGRWERLCPATWKHGWSKHGSRIISIIP